MINSKLIEMYGRRFTPFSKLAGFIVILLMGLAIAFSKGNVNISEETDPAVEHAIVDEG